ncbi:PIN domain-containing protein [Jiella pelagia]|uniref:VapC toxin family PIN domain ribonuclease n=1 Tax=Jiella pelagia TaxID=2986949 RepID=A0ABY7BX86_9HYPH|nr:VapC toxin family PIN domain ribonuclease [Jiella pelagia]WAP67581.1 VapC toxin family PIN domain ribonuclease [Jiella pelagia]
MIIADTSIWVDHLRLGDDVLADLLLANQIAGHPYVIAELALGSIRDRDKFLAMIEGLPTVLPTPLPDLREHIEQHRLYRRGIGFVDVALVTICLSDPNLRLWTRDKRLASIALELQIAFSPQAD